MTWIRVVNLSEETRECDVQLLFGQFGPIERIYLAKDKVTQICKGFAFVNFENDGDANVAIENLNNSLYKHLVLIVERAKG